MRLKTTTKNKTTAALKLIRMKTFHQITLIKPHQVMKAVCPVHLRLEEETFSG